MWNGQAHLGGLHRKNLRQHGAGPHELSQVAEFFPDQGIVGRADDGAIQVVPGGVEIRLGREQLRPGLLQLRLAQVEIPGFLTALAPPGQLLPLSQSDLGAALFLHQGALGRFHRRLGMQQRGLVVAGIDAQQHITGRYEPPHVEIVRHFDDSALHLRQQGGFLHRRDRPLGLYLDAWIDLDHLGHIDRHGRVAGLGYLRRGALQVQQCADGRRAREQGDGNDCLFLFASHADAVTCPMGAGASPTGPRAGRDIAGLFYTTSGL